MKILGAKKHIEKRFYLAYRDGKIFNEITTITTSYVTLLGLKLFSTKQHFLVEGEYLKQLES